MNIREKTMVGHFDVIGLLVGIVVSLLYLELFRATLSPMVTFPTVVTWSMGMMFALVLGIKRAILKKG